MYVLIFVFAILLKLAEIIYTTYFDIYKIRQHISYTRIVTYCILSTLLLGTTSWFFVITVPLIIADVVLFPNQIAYLVAALGYILHFTYEIYLLHFEDAIGSGNVVIQTGKYNEDLIKQTIGQPIFVVYDKHNALWDSQYKHKSYANKIFILDPPPVKWEAYYARKFNEIKKLLKEGNTIYFPGKKNAQTSPPLAIGDLQHQPLIKQLFIELSNNEWTEEDELETNNKVSNAKMLLGSRGQNEEYL